MDRPSALHQLSAMHAVALRLRDGGFDDRVIAAALDTDAVQVPSLIRVAEAKLAAVMGQEAVGFRGRGPASHVELRGDRREGSP